MKWFIFVRIFFSRCKILFQRQLFFIERSQFCAFVSNFWTSITGVANTCLYSKQYYNNTSICTHFIEIVQEANSYWKNIFKTFVHYSTSSLYISVSASKFQWFSNNSSIRSFSEKTRINCTKGEQMLFDHLNIES